MLSTVGPEYEKRACGPVGLGFALTVTTTSTTPVPGGLVTSMRVGLTTVANVAWVVPNFTVAPGRKPVPVMMTLVPPEIAPAVGEIETMSGAAVVT